MVSRQPRRRRINEARERFTLWQIKCNTLDAAHWRAGGLLRTRRSSGFEMLLLTGICGFWSNDCTQRCCKSPPRQRAPGPNPQISHWRHLTIRIISATDAPFTPKRMKINKNCGTSNKRFKSKVLQVRLENLPAVSFLSCFRYDWTNQNHSRRNLPQWTGCSSEGKKGSRCEAKWDLRNLIGPA